jgi:hypothetical protein
MARITFDTTPYELTHGRSPRGRGCWAFAPFHLRNDSSAAILSPSMTLTEAKRWAKAHIAKAQEAGTIDAGWSLWAVLG